MGLTVSRKTAKNLAVRRKNERILTVSRKKMLTVTTRLFWFFLISALDWQYTASEMRRFV